MDTQFKRLYSVDKVKFDELVALVFPAQDPGPGHMFNINCTPPKLRTAITSRMLAGAEVLDWLGGTKSG